MREVKFRAWDKENERMAKVLLIDWLNKLIDLDQGVIEKEFDEVQLLEYTGLKDKNDVEIYEGDIVSYWNKTINGGTTNHIAQVILHPSGKWRVVGHIVDEAPFINGRFSQSDLYNNRKRCEVVGNIFDNRELLEGASK